MLRRGVLLLLALAVPAPASAAGFGEAPPTALRGDQYCTRATDTPGEVAVPVLNGIRLLQATKDGRCPARKPRWARASAAARWPRSRAAPA